MPSLKEIVENKNKERMCKNLDIKDIFNEFSSFENIE